MSDSEELKIVITAAGQQAQAELAKVGQALSSVSREASNVKTTHASAAKEVEGLGKQMEGLAKKVEFVAGGFKNFRAIFAGGAATFGFVEMINQTVQWDAALARLSSVMNGNTLEASRWIAVAGAFNVPVDSLINGMSHLSTLVANNSPILRNMGIATEDTRGKLLSFDQILQRVTTHFQQNANATNAAGQANTLFGRGLGSELLPALRATPATVREITKEAENLGMIVNGKTLASFRAMEADIGRTGAAFQGLIVTIGHGLLPALDMAGQAFFSLIESNLPKIRAAIQQIVSFIVSFVTELTGVPFQISAIGQAIAGAAPAMSDYGSATGNAAGASKNLTDALQDQVKVIDEQIKGLQEATQLENYQDSLAKLKQKATDDKKKVDLDYAHYQEDLLLGNQAQAMTVLDSLSQAQQTSSNDQLEIQKAQDDETRRLRINSLNDEKQKLQERIAAIQDAASKGTAAVAGAMGAIPGIMDAAAKSGGGLMGVDLASAGGKAGKNFADEFKKALGDKDGPWVGLGKLIGTGILAGIDQAMRNGLKEAIVGPGAVKKDGSIDWGQFLKNQIPTYNGPGVPSFNADPSKDQNRAIVGYDLGGLVSGPIGAPQLAIVHGGERVMTPAQQASSSRTTSVSNPVFHIEIGSVDSEDRVYQLQRVIRMEVANLLAS